MCGLAGIISSNGHFLSKEAVREMADAISHRGPDGEGYLWWREGRPAKVTETADFDDDASVVLAHRRLAILDVTEAASQPMRSTCGHYALIFNGEIYNFIELRKELEAVGKRFTSSGDTEVLLQALIQWDASVIPRLVGMFSFAFVDFEKQTVLLARDHFGIKPLYFAHSEQAFLFASELKAIVPQLGQRPKAQITEIFRFLRYGITDVGADTMIEQVKRVPPAHWMRFSIQNMAKPVEVFEYWKPGARPCDPGSPPHQFRKRFLDSVRLHLRSDVPVGVALSGGLDSSSIVAAMRHVSGENTEIHSFSYLASDGAPNEKEWAELASKEAGTIFHSCEVSSEMVSDKLEDMAYIMDEPYISSSMLAQHTVFRAVNGAGIKVTLDGQGADEYLAGYPYFVLGRFWGYFRKLRLVKAMAFAYCVAGGGRLDSLFRVVAHSGFLALPLGVKSILAKVGLYRYFYSWMEKPYFEQRMDGMLDVASLRGADPLKHQLKEALTVTSLPMLLRYADRNSMHYSVESRVPFLDHRLVDFCLSLDDYELMGADGETKSILRKALRNIVPDELLDRRDKVGFQTPQASFLATQRQEFYTLLDKVGPRIPCIDMEALKSGFEAGRVPGDELWRCISFCAWVDCFDVTFVEG